MWAALVGRESLEVVRRALLAYLAREAGRVVPRMEILAKVWEMSFDPGSNVIDVYVNYLRRKLG